MVLFVCLFVVLSNMVFVGYVYIPYLRLVSSSKKPKPGKKKEIIKYLKKTNRISFKEITIICIVDISFR